MLASSGSINHPSHPPLNTKLKRDLRLATDAPCSANTAALCAKSGPSRAPYVATVALTLTLTRSQPLTDIGTVNFRRVVGHLCHPCNSSKSFAKPWEVHCQYETHEHALRSPDPHSSPAQIAACVPPKIQQP